MDVGLYIETDKTTPRRLRRHWGYVLEVVRNGQAITRTEFGEVEDTYHGATLAALEKALIRITKPCEIRIHAGDGWVLGMLTGQIRAWAKEEFLTAKGEPITNQKTWMHIWLLIEKLGITTEAGEHAYSGWLRREMEK